MGDVDTTDDINTSNTVAAGNGVGSQEEIDRVGDGLLLTLFGVLQLHGNTLLEGEGKVLGLVGGGEGVLGQLPHVGRGSDVGVLEDAGLVGAVSQVLVHGPGLGLGGCDRNALFGSVGEEIVTTGEALVEDGVTPGGNDLDVGLEGVEGKLKANLVVTLTGATVRDGKAALALNRHGSRLETNFLVGTR